MIQTLNQIHLLFDIVLSLYQTTKKRVSGPKCPIIGKRIQGVCCLKRFSILFIGFSLKCRDLSTCCCFDDVIECVEIVGNVEFLRGI